MPSCSFWTLLMLLLGFVASQMDKVSAGKRLERICNLSLLRAAWSAMVAYSKARKLGFKLSRRISKINCTNAVHLLVRFQKLGSALELIRGKMASSYQRRFFYLFRRNCEISSILLHRADCFHQSVIIRSLQIILGQWKCVSTHQSRIQSSYIAALRRWILFSAAKMFSAWQSCTLIACSNRDTAIKWRISCDRRRFLAHWSEITRKHKRIKIATTRMWMQNDSRSVHLFLDAWKSIAKATSIAFKVFKSKWRLQLTSAVFDRWCTAAGSSSALRLFVNGCNSNLCRFMFLEWRARIIEAEQKLHRSARASIHFLQKKCLRLWRDSVLFKFRGRIILCNTFSLGWCTHLLAHFFLTFRARVREVKIEARIAYHRCVARQAAIFAWKANVFDVTQDVGPSSPAKALRQSTAKRLWAHEFPSKSPSKSLALSQKFSEQTRSSCNQLMDFDKIDESIIQVSNKRQMRAFNGWLSIIAEIQAKRRVHTSAMKWHSSVYLHNLLNDTFRSLVTFTTRSRTRLALKFKKCTQQYALRQKRATLTVWKQASQTLRCFRLIAHSLSKKILCRMLVFAFRQWLQWSRNSRVRFGYLRRVVEPCIEDSASKRLLNCYRRAFQVWKLFLIPRRLSKRFARRRLLRDVGQLLVQWHHVALCTVDDRVADAIAG